MLHSLLILMLVAAIKAIDRFVRLGGLPSSENAVLKARQVELVTLQRVVAALS